MAVLTRQADVFGKDHIVYSTLISDSVCTQGSCVESVWMHLVNKSIQLGSHLMYIQKSYNEPGVYTTV